MHQRTKSLKNVLFHIQQRNKGSAAQSEMSICWKFCPGAKFRSEETLHVFCFFLNRRAGVKAQRTPKSVCAMLPEKKQGGKIDYEKSSGL